MATTMGSIDLKTFKDLRDDVTQYFWFESNSSASYGAGVHITLSPESTFKTSPTGQNILINTDGISIRNGLLPMMVLDNNSLDFNAIDTINGTYTNIATFGTTGARIGEFGGAHSVIDADGQRFYASDGTTQLANIGYGEGVNATSGTSVAPYYSLGIRADKNDDYIQDYVGAYSTSKTYDVGDLVLYNGSVYICCIKITTPEAWNQRHWSIPIGNYSNSEGMYTISAGYASHAEGGDSTTAFGLYSHAEGEYTKAIGDCSHAEGMNCVAEGESSHAEGKETVATGDGSHAEGMDCIAKGDSSHAGNYATIASGFAQTVLGLYNIEDDTPIVNPSNPYIDRQYAVIIGNGTSSARSNALTVDWSGNLKTLGSIFTGMTDEFAKKGDENSTGNSNHIVVAGIHICWGYESFATSTAYTEVEVTLPHTYTSVNTFLPLASLVNRSVQARTAYASVKDTSTIYVGGVATTSRNVGVVWMTIGT